MTQQNIHNLVIIGSGPAGLTAALYAARAELKPLVIAGSQPGGQLMLTTDVENYPGFPEGIMGPDLMSKMTEQAKKFGAEIINENAVTVDFSHQPLRITTDTKEFLSRAVIIATGADAKWLNLPNEQRLRGHGVSACATCDGFFFKNKDVVVIGGGDSAMEEANFLTKFANKVTIIHRREEFKASKIMLARAKNNPKINFITNAEIIDVLGDNTVTGVNVRHNPPSYVTPPFAKGGVQPDANTNNVATQEKIIPCQGFFAAIGHSPATKIFAGAGIKINDKGYIIPKKFTETNIEGVFVAGDVHDHRYRQAVTAAGWGCQAALDAEKYLTSLEV